MLSVSLELPNYLKLGQNKERANIGDLMQYLKYVFLLIGVAIIMITRMRYTKRAVNDHDQSQPYSKKEQNQLYIGYACFVLAIISIIMFE